MQLKLKIAHYIETNGQYVTMANNPPLSKEPKISWLYIAVLAVKTNKYT
jgi:hypothetical protein